MINGARRKLNKGPAGKISCELKRSFHRNDLVRSVLNELFMAVAFSGKVSKVVIGNTALGNQLSLSYSLLQCQQAVAIFQITLITC
jgi:hypothetical protein